MIGQLRQRNCNVLNHTGQDREEDYDKKHVISDLNKTGCKQRRSLDFLWANYRSFNGTTVGCFLEISQLLKKMP